MWKEGQRGDRWLNKVFRDQGIKIDYQSCQDAQTSNRHFGRGKQISTSDGESWCQEIDAARRYTFWVRSSKLILLASLHV